ncbi:MAG: nucleotide exchange factor GrpE [Alphaproteobacteria bacterium]|nr:nucleotide exchange factor GrpE [Alphaproteobacteria bacterium]
MKKNNKTDTEFENETIKEEPSDSILETETEENASEINIEELQAENQKLREDYLRAFAEAENTKKRCAQEIEKNNKYAISSFAKNLLGVADNLQRALDAVKTTENNEACEALRQGVELTQNELYKVFDKFGIHKMEIIGTHFDPNFHQVIQEVPDAEKDAGTIIAELQTGYMINDRILREAMVIVTKK